MEIKDQFELSIIMGRALAGYANRVQNGATVPFTKFMEGKEYVDVRIHLNEGHLLVKEIVEEPPKTEEPKTETPPETVALEPLFAEAEEKSAAKPRRRRKSK